MNRKWRKFGVGLLLSFLYVIFLFNIIPGTIHAEETDVVSTSNEKTPDTKEGIQDNDEGITRVTDHGPLATDPGITPFTDNIVESFHSIETFWICSEREVTIATRHETPVSRAPGIVTVITDGEIKNSGYRTFAEILRMAPGFELIKTLPEGEEMVAVRGFWKALANNVRVMIDGHFISNPNNGDAFLIFNDLPVENIKRIEIIRGPGSALYGENAFSAVINIITKGADDIDGVRVSSGYGSFDTYEGNIVFGKRYGKVEISGIAHYVQTNGFNGMVHRDVQSDLDDSLAPLGIPPASEAPGRIDNDEQIYDLNLKAVYNDIYFNGWYRNKRLASFYGSGLNLSDEMEDEVDYAFGEIGYKKTFEEKFTLRPRIYYDHFENYQFVETHPEGTTLPFDADGDGSYEYFPDGLMAEGKGILRTVGTEIPFDYELFDGNILTLGTEYRIINQKHIFYKTNLDFETLAALDSMEDVPEKYHYHKDLTRRIWSVYLQDTWDITDTVNLTLGVRHDNYNDFGGTTNPRAGLTWAFTRNGALKLLYGEAFRAPNFLEIYSYGQWPDLDPETIRTYEAGVSYRFNRYITSSVNYFHNRIRDIIQFTGAGETGERTVLANAGNARVQGIEWEARVDISKGNYIFMNYTFQHTEDDEGDDLPFVAKHKGNFGVNVSYWKYINTNVYTFVSGSRSREKDDTRDDLPAFALLNLSLIGKNFFKTMEVQGTVFNVLDKDYSDPGISVMPEDMPRPGRTFFVGLSYQF